MTRDRGLPVIRSPGAIGSWPPKELIEAGKVRPVIDKSFSLSEAPEAIRHMESGQARGKLVLTVGE